MITNEPIVERLSYGDTTRVVLIGTSRCPKDETNLPHLPHVRNNIDELARIFRDPDIVGLSESESASIIRIVDEPEASALLDKVATEAEAATDTLIVYYSGHGLHGDATVPLYLASGNTTSAGKGFNGVPINKVREAIANSPAAKRILILDCCYSGRAFEGMGDEDAAERSIDVAGTYGIAAAPGNAKALAPPGERYTLFTKQLIDILSNGIDSAKETLTLGEIFDELRARLDREARFPVPESLNWKDGRSFQFARNRFFAFADETLSDTLEGLRKTVGQLGSRLENIELKILERQSRSWYLVEPAKRRKLFIKYGIILGGVPLSVYAWLHYWVFAELVVPPVGMEDRRSPYYDYSLSGRLAFLLVVAFAGYIVCIMTAMLALVWPRMRRFIPSPFSPKEFFWISVAGFVIFLFLNGEPLGYIRF